MDCFADSKVHVLDSTNRHCALSAFYRCRAEGNRSASPAGWMSGVADGRFIPSAYLIIALLCV
jgi:hypothetical protein